MGTMRRSFFGTRLFGATRSDLLALLYGHTEQSFYLLQLVRELGAGRGALQRELRHLTEMGLIIRTPQGNQVLYRANPQSPVFTEIKGLIAKTVGVHDALRFALRSLTDQIQFAFVYGSVASQTEKADSDIDLMVLGHVSFQDVVAVLSSAQRIVNREINPTVFSIPEFQSKYASGNHFLRSIMKGPKLFVIGSEHDLTKLVAK